MTSQKPQSETREETASTTTVLREERLTREQKMARERALLDGADEVRYREGAFRPGRAATVEEARKAVDALKVERRAMPEPAPVPVVEPPAPPVDEAKRALLAPLVSGTLVGIETRFRTSEGEVVEATYESGGARRTSIFLLESGVAKPFDDLSAAIDALPMPAPPAAAPEVPPPVEETPVVEPAPEPAKKGLGSRFKLGKGKADKPAEAPAPTPEPQPEEAPAKKGGFASRLKLGKAKPEEPPAPPASAEEAPAGSSEKPGKRRFSFGRK